MTESRTRPLHLAEGAMDFFGELKHAVRSLLRAKGLTVTVVILTLALGSGANAAIFALVRGVLLRPLANRDEDRPIYIRQSARHRRRKHDVLRPGNPGSARARQDLECVRQFLHHRLHYGRSRRTTRSPC